MVRYSENRVERHTSERKFQSRAGPTRFQKYVTSIATMPIVRNTDILNLDRADAEIRNESEPRRGPSSI